MCGRDLDGVGEMSEANVGDNIDTPPENLVQVNFVVMAADIRRYAEITQDYNPLHLDPEFAATTAYGRPIAHGTMTLSLIWTALMRTFDVHRACDFAIDIKFTKPVFEGDALLAGGVRTAETPLAYEVFVKNEAGEAVVVGTATQAL